MIARLLYRLTANRPCRLIHRQPGQPYLERYWLFSLLGITAYLHRFVAADVNEPPHDHPWGHALAWVIAGGYTEQRGHIHPRAGFKGAARSVKRWHLNHIRGHDFHRISAAQPETWTLFIHTKKSQPWGFIETTEIFDEGTDPANTHCALYHQPLKMDNPDWHTHAPAGNNAGREPLNPLHNQ